MDTAWDSIPYFSALPCMVWRRICTRYSYHRRARVPRDRDGAAVAAGLVEAGDSPAAGSAAGAGARSRSLGFETTSKTKSKASDKSVRPTRARNLVRPERLELPTLCSEGRCSIRLSYGRLDAFYGKVAGNGICDASRRELCVAHPATAGGDARSTEIIKGP